jgi:DNA-binding NtrC family response regulator
MSEVQDEKSFTVMVVDRDKDSLTASKEAIELTGLCVHGFSDPVLGLQHVEGGCKECKVLISEVKMPQMTGFQLARRLKELRPEMKIIMTTTFEVNKGEFDAVFPSLQVENVVPKPARPSQLAEMVKEIYQKEKQ